MYDEEENFKEPSDSDFEAEDLDLEPEAPEKFDGLDDDPEDDFH